MLNFTCSAVYGIASPLSWPQFCNAAHTFVNVYGRGSVVCRPTPSLTQLEDVDGEVPTERC